MDTVQNGYTGIVEINGVWYVVEDGKLLYFDNAGNNEDT